MILYYSSVQLNREFTVHNFSVNSFQFILDLLFSKQMQESFDHLDAGISMIKFYAIFVICEKHKPDSSQLGTGPISSKHSERITIQWINLLTCYSPAFRSWISSSIRPYRHGCMSWSNSWFLDSLSHGLLGRISWTIGLDTVRPKLTFTTRSLHSC